jgi:ATP-dependent Clp protease ATP-binding subunit ClpA
MNNEEIKNLENILKENVFDQEVAINTLINCLHYQDFFSKVPSHLSNFFYFIGSNSSGKKYLARELSKYMGKKIKIISPYGFEDGEECKKLFGSLEDEGEISLFIKKNKSSIIYFNNIDLSIHFFQKKLVEFISLKQELLDFSKVIIIFSGTIGKNFYQNENFWKSYLTNKPQCEASFIENLQKESRIVDGQLQNVFSPELIDLVSSFSKQVYFRKLSFDTFYKITKLMYIS